MGVMLPRVLENVDCFLWVQVLIENAWLRCILTTVRCRSLMIYANLRSDHSTYWFPRKGKWSRSMRIYPQMNKCQRWKILSMLWTSCMQETKMATGTLPSHSIFFEFLLSSPSNRLPWFDPVQTYNPAVHRIRQALFHGAITSDLTKNPLPPPHPELTKYFDPPSRVLKRAHDAIKDCKSLFKVKQGKPSA